MIEIQRGVDELRFLLQRDVMEKTEELTNLVAEYGRLCHEVNGRLRRCDTCLKQGLRAEALHLAEASPNLLDAVAILDFPERDHLLEVVSMYFFTPPEPLLLDVASALNEAYALQEPLEKLLESHRLLALGRRPLAKRLTVLRSLAQLDTASPHWEADIRDMERARLSEIESESRKAVARGDAVVLKSLLAELQAEQWYEKIPATLLRNLKSRTNQSVRGNARQRIEELNAELYSAFSALEVATARILREEWNQHQQMAQLSEDDPLWEQVAPVLDWLADEDRKLETDQAFTRAVADIERALDKDHLTSIELKRLGAVLDRHEQSLPGTLEARYHNRLTTLEVTESRRRKLLIGAGFSAFATLIGVFAVVVYFSYEAEKTRRLVAAVEAFVSDGKLAEARELMERQHPAPASESWLAVQKKLVDADQSERDRAKQWQAEMETAQESTEEIRVEAALKRARELSKTTDEKIELGKLESMRRQRANEIIATREQQFRELVASASQALQTLDREMTAGDGPDHEHLRELLGEAEARVGKLRSSKASVAKELSSQAALLESRLQASRLTVVDLERKASLLDKLTDASLMLPKTTQASNNQGKFEAVLREFATTLPNDPQAAIFKAAAESCPLPSVLARQKLTDRWRRLRPSDEKDIETRVREIRSFLVEHPQSPDRELLGKYETWLAAVQRRYADDGDPDEGVLRRMGTLFNSKFIRDCHTLRDTGSRVYYLEKARVEPFGSVVTFDYLIGFNGETRKPKGMRPADMIDYKTVPPPQQEISTNVRAMIREIDLGNWQQRFRELAETVLKAEKVDPFLRYLLVLKTLEFASLGDLMLEQELTPVLENLNDDELDRSVAWMDPLNESADKSRKRAVELMAKIPPLEPIFARANQRQEQLERELFAIRFSVGWLEKTGRGEWVCRTRWSPVGEYVLHVVSRADASGSRAWHVVGRANDKSLTVDSTVAQAVGEAAVIFAATATEKSEAKTALLP